MKYTGEIVYGSILLITIVLMIWMIVSYNKKEGHGPFLLLLIIIIFLVGLLGEMPRWDWLWGR